MTVTAPPLDPAGAAIDAEIATVQALVNAVTTQIVGSAALTADNMNYTADNPITVDAFVGAVTQVVAANAAALYSYQQLLNQLQVEAVDHYMVTGWLNAATILTQYAPPPAWDERGQELQARVTYLTALVANPPAPLPGNTQGYGGSGWVTVLQNYQQQLYEAQITLVEHMMDIPGGTPAATILANMSGFQSFFFEYTSSGSLPSFPTLQPITPLPPPPPPPPPSTHTIGGTLIGLADGNTITLQLNGGNNITLSSDGPFVFPLQLAVNTPYVVTILTPVPGQAPTVLNGSGTVPGVDVGNVQIILAASTLHTISGTLSGLTGVVPVVLQNNGGDNLTLNANGPFTFATPINNGQPYNVTVLSVPAGQNVVLSNASGTVIGADISNITANCAVIATYNVGGTLTNLQAGDSITLQNNGGDDLVLTTNGSFAFATKLTAGSTYAVTVSVEPAGGPAVLTNASGTVGNADVTNIGVNCAVIPTFTVGGTLSGLSAGASITLQNNGGDNLVLSSNGSFTFATHLVAGAHYSVAASVLPNGETVNITHAAGTMPSANVTNVTVACTPVPVTRRFSPGIYVALSYAQSGLGPNGDNLSADSGAFSYAAGTLATPLTITGNYSAGTVPGGHLGTGTSDGCNTGTGTGGHTLSRNGTGPAVNTNATHKTIGVVMRYPWNDGETSQGVYNWTRMDADLAQCIALGIMWVPMVVFHTFGAAEVAVGRANATPVPAYLAAFSGQGSGGTALWRWDNTNVVPHSTAYLAAIGKRYDLCPNFAGVATQETSTSNQDSVAHNFSTAGYLTALEAESDAFSTASPNSRHWALQNFGGSRVPANATVPSVMIDQYAAYIQKNGAVLLGPDTTLCSNGVYGSCYTSGSGVQAGRYSGYHFGGTIGSGVNFTSTGPSGCSMQRAEWIGIGPGCLAGQSAQDTLDYLLGSTTVGVQPNFLKGQVFIMDWHQGAGTPNNQQFTPDGVNLINNNALSRFQTWP